MEGHLALLEGNLERAARHLHETRELMRFLPNPALCAWRSTLARVHLGLGDRDEAVRLAEEELELARRWGAPRAIAAAMRTVGVARGGAAGLACLEEAVEVVRSSEARLELAHTLVEFGAGFRRSGRGVAAKAVLADGLELAHRCGSWWWERAAREELVAAGGRPRRWATRGVDALTPSERRVAGLAATGMTNREIAQSMFVTLKAVEKHLGSVYQKLGIAGRRQLGAALAAHDEPAGPAPPK